MRGLSLWLLAMVAGPALAIGSDTQPPGLTRLQTPVCSGFEGIEGDRILPDIVRAGPGDRGCCPTEVVTLQYRLEDGRLSETVQVGASTTLSLACHGSDCAALFRAREERATRRHRHPERLSFEG